MSDSLNATEIAVGSLLAGNRGAWDSNGTNDGLFGTTSANAVRLDRNAQVTEDHADATRMVVDNGFEAIRDSFNQVTSADQTNRLCEAIRALDNRASDQRFQSELRTNDRLLALQAEINANAREQAKCCCDLKFQIAENKSELLAAILGSEARATERSLNAANAKITQLETINAIKYSCCPSSK